MEKEFLAALAGGVIGGGLTLVGVWWEHCLQNRTRNEEREEEVRGYLQSIHDEVETLWGRYMETAGSAIVASGPNRPLAIYYFADNSFFTVYEQNSTMLHRVKDVALRKRIIRVYTLAKGLIRSYQMNNILFEKSEEALLMFKRTKDKTFEEEGHAQLARMQQYASVLFASHTTLQELVEQLLMALRAALAPKA